MSSPVQVEQEGSERYQFMENQRPTSVKIATVRQDTCCLIPVANKLQEIYDQARATAITHPSYKGEIFEEALEKSRGLLKEAVVLARAEGSIVKNAFFEGTLEYIETSLGDGKYLRAEILEHVHSLMPETLCSKVIVLLVDEREFK